MRDESAKLVEELEELEGQRVGIESRKRTAIKEAREVVLDLLVSQHLLGSNDPVVVELMRAVEEKRKAINDEEEENQACYKKAQRELGQLTGPEIRMGLETLGRELSSVKLAHTVIKSLPAGITMKNRVEVSTNAKAVGEVQRIVREGIEVLQTMRHKSLSEIRNFVEEQIKKIHSIDLSVKVEIMDIEANERFQFLSSAPRTT